MDVQKGPGAEVVRNRRGSRAGERPKDVDAKTQKWTQRTLKTEKGEGALPHATEAEVLGQGIVRPTTDEERSGRVADSARGNRIPRAATDDDA